MPRNIVLILGFIVTLSFFSYNASAESIELKDGQTIEANILSFSDEGIKIETSGETRIISNTDISKINGRSLTADLTVIGLQNKLPEKKQAFGDVFASLQKNSNNKNNSSIDEIKKTIEKTFRSKMSSLQKSPNKKDLPDWFWPVVISIFVVLYLFVVIPYCMMAEKLGLSSGWQFLTLIPILQLLAIIKISGKPLWWFFLFFIPLVNIIFMILMYCGISERCGKNKLLGILMLIPVINIFFPWYLALNIPKKEDLQPTSATGHPIPKKRYSITPFEDESQKS